MLTPFVALLATLSAAWGAASLTLSASLGVCTRPMTAVEEAADCPCDITRTPMTPAAPMPTNNTAAAPTQAASTARLGRRRPEC